MYVQFYLFMYDCLVLKLDIISLMSGSERNPDGKVVDSTFVTDILEDLDTFVGGKKRKLNDDAKSEEEKPVGSRMTPLIGSENKRYQGAL